ncbi:hypothetical protein HPB50_019362 [Hyalomma asiaticum]|uniref:Uncharacterized protein n=1 Tax=Hyalomma asiaticum TaxID=266040 RepID=A0ACB7SJ80_HYAAI|nr:hypothetical protein HPB50_019362 [Hyalomma asiaticum]
MDPATGGLVGLVLPTGTTGPEVAVELPVYIVLSTIGPEGAPGFEAAFLKDPEANVSMAENALPRAPLYWLASKGTQPPFLQTPRLRRRSVWKEQDNHVACLLRTSPDVQVVSNQ